MRIFLFSVNSAATLLTLCKTFFFPLVSVLLILTHRYLFLDVPLPIIL